MTMTLPKYKQTLFILYRSYSKLTSIKSMFEFLFKFDMQQLNWNASRKKCCLNLILPTDVASTHRVWLFIVCMCVCVAIIVNILTLVQRVFGLFKMHLIDVCACMCAHIYIECFQHDGGWGERGGWGKAGVRWDGMALPGVCVAETRVSTHTHTHAHSKLVFSNIAVCRQTHETRRDDEADRAPPCDSNVTSRLSAAQQRRQRQQQRRRQHKQLLVAKSRARQQRQSTTTTMAAPANESIIEATATSSRCASAYTLTHTHTHALTRAAAANKQCEREWERALVSHTHSLKLRADCSRAQAFTLSRSRVLLKVVSTHECVVSSASKLC